MKGKHIPALAVLCCALSLTAPVWAAPAVEGLSQSAVTATTAVPAAQPSIRDVTALSTVYGDGESVSAVALHYPKPIDASRLKTSDFTVAGKTIDKVYANDVPETAQTGKTGDYVIVSLVHPATPLPTAASQNKPKADQGDKGKEGANALNGGDAPMYSDRKAPDLSVSVSQTGTVYATDGTAYGPTTAALTADKTVDAVKDAFQTYLYKDPATGYEMPYNLYLPKGYDADKTKTYPMVVFIADASANINDPKAVLYQGNGAIVWATPEEQAKHPAIVLAPQYTEDLIRSIGMMTTDTHQWTKGLTLVTDLILDVSHKYRVDKDRIYGTGQSQGGMANIAISDAYPDLFAGQYLVACQWDTQEMEKLKDKNLWITVCQGDTKAFPGMNEATALWEKDGAVVARSRMWDSTGGTPVFEQMMRVMEDQQAPINYTVFQGGSHMYTWSFAYNIEGIRDWLFAQTKAKDVLKQTAPAQGAAQQGEKGHGPKGNPAGRALLNTGIAYLYGQDGATDYDVARQCFQKAWADGNMKAGRYLGLMAAHGWGVKQSDAQAAQWYTKAQEQGDITSMYLLGQCYEQGKGVKQDYAKAKSLYEKAAQRTDHVGAPAMVYLGDMYAKGLGVAADTAKAKAWYQKAAATGNLDAIEALKAMG